MPGDTDGMHVLGMRRPGVPACCKIPNLRLEQHNLHSTTHSRCCDPTSVVLTTLLEPCWCAAPSHRCRKVLSAIAEVELTVDGAEEFTLPVSEECDPAVRNRKLLYGGGINIQGIAALVTKGTFLILSGELIPSRADPPWA